MSWLMVAAVAAQVCALLLTVRRRPLIRNRTLAGAALALAAGLTLWEASLLRGVFAAEGAAAADSAIGYVSLLAACVCLVLAASGFHASDWDSPRDREGDTASYSLDDTLRGVVHDLRNMLHLMQGSAELLRIEAGEQAAGDTLLNNIRYASLRSAELLDQLDGARRKTETPRPECDAAQVIREARELLAVAVPTGVGVAIDVGPTPLNVRCDPSELTRILLNLVVNAGEAIGDRGGLVNVSLAIRDIDSAWRALSRAKGERISGPHAFLRILDDGPGLPPKLIERLFDEGVSSKADDRGIGLAIVLDIVKRRGGAIGAANIPRRGAAFEVALPLASVAPAPKAKRTGSTPSEEVVRPSGQPG